ncbi:hypothetical protein GGI21_003175, partial [Coemansia aciculifera]
SSDNTVLSGTVTVQLMEGQDTNNLMPVLTIASNLAASLGQVTFTPPSNLPGSPYYAVRVTASVDGPHYSHQFQAGNPAITGSMSTTTSTTPKPATTSSTVMTTSQEQQASSTSGSSSNPSSSSSSSTKSSLVSSSSSESESNSSESDSLESKESSSKHNGVGRPAVVAAGALGAAIVVAMF